MTWIYNGTPELDALSSYRTGLAVCLVVPTLMAVIVGLRIYTRACVVRSIGFDDYLTVAAAVTAAIYAALWITQSRQGLGLPISKRPPQNLPEYGKQNYAGRPIYVFSTLCFKLALCVSYLRLTRGAYAIHARIAIWTGLGFTAVYNVAYIFTLLFSCQPIAAAWDYSIKDKRCLAMAPYYYSTGLLTMFNDLVLFVLPLPQIWRLQMNRRTKFGLSVMFLLGLITTFCSIMRIVAIESIVETGNTTDFILWGVVEACVGTMTSSMPALRPLFVNLTRKVHSQRYGQGYDRTGVPMQKLPPHHLGSKSQPGTTRAYVSNRDPDFVGTQYTVHREGSEETILRNPTGARDESFARNNPYTIKRTTEVHVSSTASGANQAGLLYQDPQCYGERL